jgi:hypothetical protein
MSDRFNGFQFNGPRLDDFDFPRIGAQIGVGEDIIHAFIDTETNGKSTDSKGRIKMLYEPHVAFRNSSGGVRATLVRGGLAYKSWGEAKYPRDSYPRLHKAIAIDETVGLIASSWGFPQILGENFALAGYDSIQDMVQDMLTNEDRQLQAMVNFLKNAHLDDELRVLEAKLQRGQRITPDDCRPVVRGYNGSQYAKHNYHGRFAANLNKWAGIPDTEWEPGMGEDDWNSPTPIRVPLPKPTVVENIYDGKYSPVVENVQRLLDKLGYPEVGGFDGKWGSKTRAAVLAFRADNELPLEPVIDDDLMRALMASKEREVSDERATATIKDLRKKGAEDVGMLDQLKIFGITLGGGSVLGKLSDVLDQAKGIGRQLSELTAFLDPIKTVIMDNLWLIGIVGGGLIIWKVSQLQGLRLVKHRTGQDVSE